MKKPIIGILIGCLFALTVTVVTQTFYQLIVSDNALNISGIKVENKYEYYNTPSIGDDQEVLKLDTESGKTIDLTAETVKTSYEDDDNVHPTYVKSNDSNLPSPGLEVEPDPEYLKLLRENGVDVSTEAEFMTALETAHVIIVKDDIVLSSDHISLENINVLVIDEGVTLTITTLNFYAECKIVNLGEILVLGRMIFYSEPDYTMIGKVRIEGDAEIGFNAGQLRADDIDYFLNKKTLYNSLNIVASSNDGKPVEIIIDNDIAIPPGKTLWINSDSVLRVNKGVTLTNNGRIIGYNDPIVEGNIYGIGKLMIYK